MKEYKSPKNFKAIENTILDTIKIGELDQKLAGFQIKDAWINPGGWQSWSPCFEIEKNKKQAGPKDCILKAMGNLLEFPQTKFKASKNLVLAQFVSYLRWQIDGKDLYLFFASLGSNDEENLCPPVQYIFDRKNNRVTIEIADKGKDWKSGELMAKIEIFTSDDYFQAKDKLKKLFDLGQFEDLKFLSGKFPQEPILGWESWYNHYTKIDEKIISQDIKSLKDTKNLINFLADKEDAKSSPVIFQIDDGWESMVGDWSIHSEKFSKGLKPLVQEIEKSSFIPGLWIAPFLIYQQCPIAQAHPDWLLKDEKGNLVPAGVNPGWNGLKNFFTFDLSNDQVLEYLDSIMEKAINEWGFRYLKLDFMYAGMLYGKFQKGGAAFQHYNKAIRILTRRKENNKGQRLAYLGCGIPMEQSYKNFPLSRIGCDTYEHWINPLMRAIRWNGRNEAYLNLKDSLGRSLWDKTIYFNDPDVIFIRNENCRLTQDEKILIASVNSMFGSQVMYSDDPEKSSSEDQVELARKISDLIKKYQDKEFSVKPLSSDIYQVQSRDGKIKAKIELGKNHKITLE